MNPKLYALLTSRKFYAAIVGLLAIVLKQVLPNFPLDEQQLTEAVILLAAYILGTGIEARNHD